MSSPVRRTLAGVCSAAVLSSCVVVGISGTASATPAYPVPATFAAAAPSTPGAPFTAPQTITPPPPAGSPQAGLMVTPVATKVSGAVAPGLLFAGNARSDFAATTGQIYDNIGRTLYGRGGGDGTRGPAVITYLGKPAIALPGGSGWTVHDAAWKTLRTITLTGIVPGEGYIRTNGDGTKALLTFLRTATADLTPYGGAKAGSVVEGVVREIDLSTGATTFEWSSLAAGPGQVPLADSRVAIAQGVNYTGLNGASYDTDGNVLVSAAGTGSVYKIDRATGGFTWILGGKRNQFAFTGSDAEPTRPIDVTRDGSGRLAFLDDSAAKSARSVAYTLDENAKSAALDWRWAPQDAVSDVRTGGNQVLPNGNRLITFGAKGAVVEVTPNGTVVFESQIPAGTAVTRTQRAEWTSTGNSEVNLSAQTVYTGGKIPLYASWNGATELVSWQVSVGPDKDHLTPSFTTPATRLETRFEAPFAPSDVGYAVTALDKDGKPIPGGTSTFRFVDEIIKAVSQLPDPSVMGTPLGLPTYTGTLWVRDFSTGVGVYNPQRGTVSLVYGPLADAYKAAGGPAGPYGAPLESMKTYADGGSSVVLGDYSVLVWSAATGAHRVVGPMAYAWRAYASPATEIGYPTAEGGTDPAGTGCLQTFTLARLYAPTCDAAVAFPVSGPIGAKWDTLRQWFGYPVDGPEKVNGNTVQRFARGTIVQTQAGDVRWVFGGINDQWQQQGGPTGFLGLPTTDELPVGDGVGRVSQFEHGSVYWSPNSGVGEVHGELRDRWLQLGGPTSFLGYPVGTQRVMGGSAAGGLIASFQRGSLVWNQATGIHEVHGGIFSRWGGTTDLGFWVGFPLTDEMAAGDGRGRYQVFQNASIFWTPENGAYIIHGGINDKWASQNWNSGPLGYPISDEERAGTGRLQRFEHGVIVWGPYTGTHILPPGFDYTDQLNMGMPTSDVAVAGNGAEYVLYERGAVYTNVYASPRFTIPVFGGVWAKYQSLGAHNSCLGTPTSHEYDTSPAGARGQQFTTGTITWYPDGSTVAKCFNGKTY
ncbi:arylsulfotransferase family protein [Yinghuangia seranimata]|uniref:arylsulfotransferase family protein n=1 Tax=Yinghuangia seranimata TaxID=408067 RepID=UPI00248AE9D8|nr:arylsulfotransferase family protein [Yinghuangia seranimata]MDI2131753.1 arylsulfotransferase family protein [Yinghuangia seranimata]